MDITQSNCESKSINENMQNNFLLKDSVQEAMQKYFNNVGTSSKNQSLNIYDMVLGEVEKPLLEAVMQHVNGNQSNAAKTLGLSRGTLRKKLKIYGML